tara:strand:- start:509 stop:829 length:321 start_codon:yes stop_codon:yes gene_type:complete
MKKNTLKNIIRKEINRLKEQRRPSGNFKPRNPGGMGGVPTHSGPSAQCSAAIQNAQSLVNQANPSHAGAHSLNERNLKQIWSDLKGAIHKIFTDCGEGYVGPGNWE